jgi:3-oxoadipate enol-lactonase
MAHNSQFRTSDGANIAYTLHPPPQKNAPRLVLVHSLALDRSVWDSVVAKLAPKAEIVTYDCRGHGKSARKPGVYTAELFARDLSELLDHLGWPNATIVGCSMGGCAALAFAQRYPAKTKALGLIDTTASYGSEAPKQFRERAAAAKTKGMAGLIDFQLTRWFSDKFRAEHPELLKTLSDKFTANDLDCYAASCALLGDADLRAGLGGLKMPVAIVVGEEDYATPIAMAEQLHTAIPQSSMMVIPGGRHLTPIECPDQIAGQIRALLSRV